MQRLEIDRHTEILEQGRVLLRSPESVVAFEEPFLLASRCQGAALELAIRRVTSFAFVLSGIIGTFVALGAAPPHLAAVVAVWLAASVWGRLFLRRRRRELGRFLLDLEHGVLMARTLAGGDVELPLAEATARTDRSEDGDAPVWVVLVAKRASAPVVRYRICRGMERDVDRVLAVLRKHKIPVERAHEP